MSDSIFICGLSSLPNIIQNSQESLNLFYQLNNIQITENGVIINADTTINGNLTVNGQINATGDIIANGISLINHVHGNGNNGQDTTAPKG
jgi:phage baseplate assembly protein V